MSNKFDKLVKLALNEASLRDYISAAKTNVKNAFKPSSLVAGALNMADASARRSGITYGGQFGNIAKGITNLTTNLTTQAEKIALEKFERPKGNPKNNDKVVVNLPFLPTSIVSKFGNVQAVTGGTSYTITLSDSLAADSIAVIDKQGYQTQIFYYKNKKQLFKPKTGGEPWPTYVGLHYHQEGNFWVIDTDVRKTIPDFNKKKQFIANYKKWSSPLDPAIKAKILKAADMDEVMKILKTETEYGKMSTVDQLQFITDLTTDFWKSSP